MSIIFETYQNPKNILHLPLVVTYACGNNMNSPSTDDQSRQVLEEISKLMDTKLTKQQLDDIISACERGVPPEQIAQEIKKPTSS